MYRKKIFLFIGRICLSIIFLVSATSKILGKSSWDSEIAQTEAAFTRWQQAISVSSPLHGWIDRFSYYTPILMGIAVMMEILGALFVLLGFKVRLGSSLLAFFILFVTLIMHPFWLSYGEASVIESIMFMKNLAIFGGLLILASCAEEGEI